jgi:HPt (histidine-containing phosphotransfer) domain-containing protein
MNHDQWEWFLNDACDGDPELRAELIALYLEQAPQLLAAMSVAIEERNADMLRRSAHTLKSNMSVLGALELADLCDRIEHLAYLNRSEEAHEPLKELVSKHDALISWLREQM